MRSILYCYFSLHFVFVIVLRAKNKGLLNYLSPLNLAFWLPGDVVGEIRREIKDM